MGCINMIWQILELTNLTIHNYSMKYQQFQQNLGMKI